MKYFILMADVISSGDKDSVKLMLDFKSIVKLINRKFVEKLRSPLTITLGDEFQGIVNDIDSGIKIILGIEEEILNHVFDFKLRYVLYEGDIATPVNKTIAFEMLGTGLTGARTRLLKMKDEQERFSFILENKFIERNLNDCFLILQKLVDEWDWEKDYSIAYNLIKYKDYKIVADKLNRNRSIIWKRAKSLNIVSYYAIKRIIDSISNL